MIATFIFIYKIDQTSGKVQDVFVVKIAECFFHGAAR